jgi:hypothetical protein
LGGIVLSLRSTVVALGVSGATVVVLAAATAGMFQTPPVDPLVPQANPVNQQASAQQPNLLPAPQPAPARQPIPAPQSVAPQPDTMPHQVVVAQPAAARQSAVGVQPVAHAPSVVRQEPATHPAVVLRPAAPPQSSPAHEPVPISDPAPDDHQDLPSAQHGPDASPPPQKSRTVNTEPCACDGKMRRVPTHWDPPHN